MKESLKKIFILAIGLAIMIGAGCQEKGRLTVKKSRIIAAENIQLKDQLKQRELEIKRLKKQLEDEVKHQKELLAKCLKQKEVLQNQLQQKIKEQLDDVLTAVIDKNTELREENESLRSEMEQLKAKIKQLTKQQRHRGTE